MCGTIHSDSSAGTTLKATSSSPARRYGPLCDRQQPVHANYFTELEQCISSRSVLRQSISMSESSCWYQHGGKDGWQNALLTANQNPTHSLVQDKQCPVALFHADDGERVGTYSGHDGAVFNLDVSSALLGPSTDTPKATRPGVNMSPHVHALIITVGRWGACRRLQVAHHSRG